MAILTNRIKERTGFEFVEFFGDVSFHHIRDATFSSKKRENSYRIVNFESFFIDTIRPRFEIHSDMEDAVRLLRRLEVDCISVANNHTLDGDNSILEKFLHIALACEIDVIGVKSGLPGYVSVRLFRSGATSNVHEDFVEIVGAIDNESFSQSPELGQQKAAVNLYSLEDFLNKQSIKTDSHGVILFLHGGLTYDFHQKKLLKRLQRINAGVLVSHAHVPGFWCEKSNDQFSVTSLGNLVFANFLENVPAETGLWYRNSLIERISIGLSYRLFDHSRVINVYISRYRPDENGLFNVNIGRFASFKKPAKFRLLVVLFKIGSFQMKFNRLVRKCTRVYNSAFRKWVK